MTATLLTDPPLVSWIRKQVYTEFIPRSIPLGLAIGSSQSATLIVTELMTTSSGAVGRSVSTFCMVSSTSRPFTSLPNSEYCGGRPTPLRPLTMKNCDAVRVRPGVGHGDGTDLVLAGLRAARRRSGSRARPTGAGRVAALAHESVDDAVEDHAVVVVVQREVHEVVDRLRRLDRVERDHERAEGGLHRGRVSLRRVDAHVGLSVELAGDGRRTIEGGKGSRHRCGTLAAERKEAAMRTRRAPARPGDGGDHRRLRR